MTREKAHIGPCKVLAVLLLVASVSLIFTSRAFALEVRSSATDHLQTVDIQVKMAADDSTGTVMLLVDGTVVDVRPGMPGQTIDFGKLALGLGSHKVRADLRGGSANTLSAAITVRVWAKPLPARLVRPVRYAAQRAPVAVRVGPATTLLQMRVNGRVVHTRMVRPGTLVSMAALNLAPGVNTIELVASNPVASTTSRFSVRRLDFPWPTCIIIDKSERRLYWVKDGVLVKVYPVAIGKPHTPTPERIWRIGAKYHSNPRGVFGPRKMRLYRKTAHGYQYSSYLIHGTNQEWVIGTMASHGCIRMYNRDVLELYPQVPIGTMVMTRR